MTMTKTVTPDPMRAIHAPPRQRHDLRFSEDIPPYYWVMDEHFLTAMALELHKRALQSASAASRKGWRSRKRMVKAQKQARTAKQGKRHDG